jgi:uncharacterized protein (DUF952 family)
MIYHIATAEEWERCASSDEYAPLRLEEDGFIHCSTASQVQRTAQRLFSSLDEIFLLCIDEEKESDFIKYENLEGGTGLFPHIYHRIPRSSIINVIRIKNSSAGFLFPASSGVVTS